ncbi:NUDIX domain-containing protein [Propioniciclava sp.]|uniref:NUDIX hydrolase n=1 Tax=Propioniciclava sp. TaxID=2038686 RepID=UPI00260294E5|nr:NUDIX domain-containing protein [Propioniciclava sp.]
MFPDGRVGAYAWIEQDDRILLTLWQGDEARGIEPHWSLPGGGVEWGEQIIDATVREIREETGYDAEIGPVLGVAIIDIDPAERITASERPLRLVRVVSRARVTGGELTDEIDGSTLRAQWFTPAEMTDLPLESLVHWTLELVGATPQPTLSTDE